jgi:hypothetical protein
MLLGFALPIFSAAGYTAGGNYSPNADLKPILRLIDKGEYHSAIEQLQILDNICRRNCEEYSKLKGMIDSCQKSASSS